ncbi:hypothetical protein R6Q59_004966 [Mikania micrantha]
MVSSDIRLGNVVGGKTARACDNCIRKRARWYCAADDAFLCQSCDGSVHSANPLARRHQRLRLKVASSSLDKPQWHQGFTKKPRTPRGTSRQTPKSEESSISFNPLHLVPEIGRSDYETTNEEQLLYQVPVFDPFAAELCISGNSNHEKQTEVTTPDHHRGSSKVMADLKGLLLPSDVELAEFAADVESLLGKGLDEESSFGMEGIWDCNCSTGERVKVEEEEEEEEVEDDQMMQSMEMMKLDPFELRFDYDSQLLWEEKVGVGVEQHKHMVGDDEEKKKRNKRILKLDYEAIIGAWDEQRSPWTTGERPELDTDDWWPAEYCGMDGMHYDGDMMSWKNEGREARVSRYREKRRRRLFSKKIRYQVRKLNADKRPRIKGRFVKTPPASASAFPFINSLLTK